MNDHFSQYRISMVGTSGAGKTCFLSCLYERFQDPRQGFTLLAENDHAMDLEEMWESIEDLENGKRFEVAGTSNETDFGFSLCYRGRRVIHVNWADYRGGLLDVRSADGNDGESVHGLIEQVKGSDEVMLIVDAQILMENDLRTAKKKIRIRRLQHFFQQFLADVERGPELSVQVMLSKSEAYLGNASDKAELMARSEDMLAPVIAMCREASICCHIHGVSVIGGHHSKDHDGVPIIKGNLEPIHVDELMLEVIRNLLRKRRRLLEKLSRNRHEELKEYNDAICEAKDELRMQDERSGMLDSIFSSLQSKESGRDASKRLESSIDVALKNAEDLDEEIQRLMQECSDMDAALTRLEASL